jgi:hypothetical protein
LIAALDAATGFVDPNFDKTPESTGCGLIGQGGADCGSGFGAVKSIVIDPVRGFLLDGEVAVNWDPEIDTNTGVFAVKVVPGQMVIYGGEFSRVNRRPQPGYAQFPALPGERPWPSWSPSTWQPSFPERRQAW